jgi:hypothetical protein
VMPHPSGSKSGLAATVVSRLRWRRCLLSNCQSSVIEPQTLTVVVQVLFWEEARHTYIPNPTLERQNQKSEESGQRRHLQIQTRDFPAQEGSLTGVHLSCHTTDRPPPADILQRSDHGTTVDIIITRRRDHILPPSQLPLALLQV